MTSHILTRNEMKYSPFGSGPGFTEPQHDNKQHKKEGSPYKPRNRFGIVVNRSYF